MSTALRSTVVAGRRVGPGTRREIAAAAAMPAGLRLDHCAPSRSAIRRCIDAQVCPFCGLGPFAMLPVHTNKSHGIDKWDLRELAGLKTTDPLCSSEVREKMAAVGLARDPSHVAKATEAARRHRRPQRWTTAGMDQQRVSVSQWMAANPEEAERQRLLASRMPRSPEAEQRRIEAIKQRARERPKTDEERQAFTRRMQSPEMRAKRAAVRAAKLQPCGTAAAYKRGCRCDQCRDAKARSRKPA